MQSMEHAKFTKTGTKVTDSSVTQIPEKGWLRDVLVLITINVRDSPPATQEGRNRGREGNVY